MLLKLRSSLARALHIHVEAGEVDDADLIRRTVRLLAGLEHFGPGFAIFQLDLLADQLDDLAFVAAANVRPGAAR